MTPHPWTHRTCSLPVSQLNMADTGLSRFPLSRGKEILHKGDVFWEARKGGIHLSPLWWGWESHPFHALALEPEMDSFRGNDHRALRKKMLQTFWTWLIDRWLWGKWRIGANQIAFVFTQTSVRRVDTTEREDVFCTKWLFTKLTGCQEVAKWTTDKHVICKDRNCLLFSVPFVYRLCVPFLLLSF